MKVGRPNQLRVEVRSGQDSRWYSGAGLHRSAVLHVTDPARIPVDGDTITTRELRTGLVEGRPARAQETVQIEIEVGQ